MTDTDTALADLICLDMHKFDQPDWRAQQQAMLAETGALVLSGFLQADALVRLQDEAEAGLSHAYFNPQTHTVYLTDIDPEFDEARISATASYYHQKDVSVMTRLKPDLF